MLMLAPATLTLKIAVSEGTKTKRKSRDLYGVNQAVFMTETRAISMGFYLV
jgi:hypothetical protein